MKYIRTKDTIFEVVGENEKVLIVKAKGNPQNTYSKSKCQTDVIKSADTIEELCDEFVIKAYISSYPQIYHSVNLKELNEFREKDTIIYGAIWTDKGLIYVAKMNDKGELELL